MPKGKESKETDKEELAKEVVGAQFALNAKVLCMHIDNLYYEAKIIALEQGVDGEPLYTVHYQGWNQRHDEKIRQHETSSRFLENTPANVERAKAEMREAQARTAGKRKRRSALDEKKTEGSDSRASTPSDKRASSSRAASITSEKGVYGTSTATSTASTGSRKRKPPNYTEVERIPDFVRKEDIKIEIPTVLRDILVDDQDMIVRQMYLVRVPARFTIAEIIRQYSEYTGSANKEELEPGSGDNFKSMVTLIESSKGLQDYFNTALGTQLLYKFERPQYLDLVNEHSLKDVKEETTTKRRRTVDSVHVEEGVEEKMFKPSEYYGFIHLARLFVRFGSMLSLTTWGDRTVESIVWNIQDFLKFLDANRHKFFDVDTDYEVASPQYQRRVWTT